MATMHAGVGRRRKNIRPSVSRLQARAGVWVTRGTARPATAARREEHVHRRDRSTPVGPRLTLWSGTLTEGDAAQMLGLVFMAALCGGYLYFMSRFSPAVDGRQHGFHRVGHGDGGSVIVAGGQVRQGAQTRPSQALPSPSGVACPRAPICRPHDI